MAKCNQLTALRFKGLRGQALSHFLSGGHLTSLFTARRMQRTTRASALLAVVFCLSVCHMHACFVTKPNNALRMF